MKHLFLLLCTFGVSCHLHARTLEVGQGRQYTRLQAAAANATAGDTILIREGIYSGGDYIENLHGTPQAWITIRAHENEQVLFQGNTQAFHLTDPAYIRIEGLSFTDQTGNGVNIDDGGTPESPAHHVIISNCSWLGMNATGNNDELKLSGLDDFSITQCRFQNGSSGGSLVDMVGCHRGVFEANTFLNAGSNCIQAKGATKDITIIRNRFINGGQRSINIGGSTGLEFFRPLGTLYEASDIHVYSNIFEGSVAPIAFVGAVNCDVINNTIFRPERWAIRILQETTEPGFLPCGHNTFRNNIVIFTSEQPAINIGGNTAPESFTFSNNLWYHPNNSNWSGPNTPVSEPDVLVNIDPLITDSLGALASNSPVIGKGYSVNEPVYDFNRKQFAASRSIGAVEGANPVSVHRREKLNYLCVFPNPMKEIVTIMSSENSFGEEIRILNILGETVWRGKLLGATNIPTVGWISGTYVILYKHQTQLVVKQ